MSSDAAATAANGVPAVPCPVAPGRLADDAKDEGDTAPGEHGACWPDDLPGFDECPHQFDEGAGEDGREDLRHRHGETERRLAEDVDGDDHPGEVEPWVPNAGEHHRITAAADAECSGGNSGHGPSMPGPKTPPAVTAGTSHSSSGESSPGSQQPPRNGAYGAVSWRRRRIGGSADDRFRNHSPPSEDRPRGGHRDGECEERADEGETSADT